MEWQYLGDKKIEVRCLEADRADVFRRLSSLPAGVEDIEIVTPGLDAIYTHFLDQEAAE